MVPGFPAIGLRGVLVSSGGCTVLVNDVGSYVRRQGTPDGSLGKGE